MPIRADQCIRILRNSTTCLVIKMDEGAVDQTLIYTFQDFLILKFGSKTERKPSLYG